MPPEEKAARDFRLGDWLVRPSLGRLVGPEGEVQLEPRAMEVLVLLAANAGGVVPRQKMIDEVWQQEFVGDGVVSGVVSKLRKALGDDTKSPSYIETITKRGYRLLVRPVGRLEMAPRFGGDARGRGPAGAVADSGPRRVAALALAEPAATVTPFPEVRTDPERPVFVAREAELARLDSLLDLAMASHGRIAFVTGEAGTGKTALIQELVRRAGDAHPELVAAVGVCSAQTGMGDAYAPWRQLLALLTGDVEAGSASGFTTVELARRLWTVAPVVAESVATSGRDLVGTLIPGSALLARAEATAPAVASWLGPLRELIQRKAAMPPDVALQQAAVFMQATRVFQAVARRRPLLLVLEDLHWADAGSTALLFSLGRELAAHRILVLGSFRPTEVAIGRGGERHPLEPVVAELRSRHDRLMVELGDQSDRAFVNALIDSEPNRLGEDFRESLHRRTAGHALFTVEVLRTLQDREMLVRDPERRWVAGAQLDWGALPERVEGVLGARIERLPEPLRELLRIASVEGESFTAEVVARVQKAEPRETIQLLSRELETRHRLVSARGVRSLAAGRLSLFGFSHVLFQRYLYGTLNEVERVQLHHDVGVALEALYGDGTEEIAVRLARHFEESQVIDRAVHYLHQAGIHAIRMTANQEAIGHLEKAIELLMTQPESDERDRAELALQISIQAPLIATSGFGGPRVKEAVERAHSLVERIGDEDHLVPVLHQLGVFEGCARSLSGGIALGQRVLTHAEEHEDAAEIILASLQLGLWRTMRGELEQGRQHFETAVSLYDPKQHRALSQLSGLDPGVASLAHLSYLTSHMGYLDQGLLYKAKALELGERIGHPYSQASARYGAIWPHFNRHEFEEAREQVEALGAMVETHGFVQMAGFNSTYTGLLRIAEGRIDQTTLEHCARGLSLQRATGMKTFTSVMLWILALAHRAAGDTEQALAVLDEADELMAGYGERLMEPALLLCRAEILLALQGAAAAESLMLQSLDVARRQQARLHELHTAAALARLWQGQGRHGEARELLSPVYSWFTEGLDTPPLVATRALLDELDDLFD